MCPTCKRKLPFSADANPFRPFCSERCRLVDLGAWLDGVHRISSPMSDEEFGQSQPTTTPDDDDERSSHN